MGIYQVIEVCIVGLLLLLQVYVCVLVFRLARRISTFLPDRKILFLKNVSIKKNEDDSIKEVVDEYELKPSGKIVDSLFFLAPEFDDQLIGNKYYFRKKGACLSSDATIRLAAYENGIATFCPCCNVMRMRHLKFRTYFSNTFDVVEDGAVGGFDPVVCDQFGLCKRVADGWQIIKKCKIKM